MVTSALCDGPETQMQSLTDLPAVPIFSQGEVLEMLSMPMHLKPSIQTFDHWRILQIVELVLDLQQEAKRIHLKTI